MLRRAGHMDFVAALGYFLRCRGEGTARPADRIARPGCRTTAWRPATHQGTRMESLYPQGPAVVPEQLTAPSSNYRRNAWLAMLGLGGFIAVYLGLLVWFGWTAYRLVAGLLQG
ncbi:hypothetical protein, partial [Xanthomonas euvesicatoria]|uniref:hypothetical protein n=1 Tax=Xanthomonas euvesicatoria TaxID=456327 RepID=UPI00131E3CE6